MITAGIDVSGKTGVGNYAYMAIVIGTIESINRILNNLGQEYIHMSRIKSNREQNKIISKLRFDREQNLVLCLRIDMDVIVNELFNSKKNKKRRIPRVRLVRILNYQILKLVRDRIGEFLAQYGCALSDISFECDSDCRRFVKDNGLQYIDVGGTHVIADIVAWANNRNIEPYGVISLDLTDQLRNHTMRKIKL